MLISIYLVPFNLILADKNGLATCNVIVAYSELQNFANQPPYYVLGVESLHSE